MQGSTTCWWFLRWFGKSGRWVLQPWKHFGGVTMNCILKFGHYLWCKFPLHVKYFIHDDLMEPFCTSSVDQLAKVFVEEVALTFPMFTLSSAHTWSKFSGSLSLWLITIFENYASNSYQFFLFGRRFLKTCLAFQRIPFWRMPPWWGGRSWERPPAWYPSRCWRCPHSVWNTHYSILNCL